VELTFSASVASVEKDQPQHYSDDAPSYDQRDSGIDESYKRRASRDQDAQGYDGDDEANHEFVHGGIVREASGDFRVLGWGTWVNQTAAPSPADLAAELGGLLRSSVTSEGLRNCAAILSLALTRAKSASDETADRAVAAHTLITEAAKRVDDGAYGPAATLLGLAPGTRGSLLKERRRQAADLLHVSPEHLRKEREPLLVEAVADELYAADSAYRLRHRHRTEAERQPEQSRLGIDWLKQHRSYRRIWTPVSGMKNDLKVLRGYLAADDEDQPAIADRLANITWQWARFELALERFVEEQGGLWLLADVDSEIAAADAIYQLQLNVPLGEADSSWLRTMLMDTPHEELDGFGDRLVEAGERRRELMGLWLAWASCPAPDESDCACPLHAWLLAAEQFIRLIDDDWYRVADFYRGPGNDVGDQIDQGGD
jgi:hypothetical protein